MVFWMDKAKKNNTDLYLNRRMMKIAKSSLSVKNAEREIKLQKSEVSMHLKRPSLAPSCETLITMDVKTNEICEKKSK